MKTTIKLLTLSMLSLILIMGLSTSVDATTNFDSEVWKNEGIYTPLTPFKSFEWSEDIHTDFADQFTDWSDFMEQSYYLIMDAEEIRLENEANDSDINLEDHTFRGYYFEEILKNAFDDGYKVGFTYQDRDYRSDFDSNRYDIFAMYGSNKPDQKHLYIFSVDMDTKEPVVFYIDGDTMVEGEKFEIKETANEELKAIFYPLMTGEGDTTAQTTEVSSSYITDWDEFSQLSQDEQQRYCTITPWYEIPDGFCSNKGLLPEEHWELAREYGRETGAGIDESVAATGAQYRNNYPGNEILEDWEVE